MAFRIRHRDRRSLPDKASRPDGRPSMRAERIPGAKARHSIRSAGVGLLLAAGVLWAAWSCADGAVQPAEPPVQPDAVLVTPESAGLAAPGDAIRFRAGVRDQNGFELPGVGVTWTSSAPGIASVDTSGVVTAAGVGSATITATAGSASGTATVTILSAAFRDMRSIPESERAALMALYNATGGPNWLRSEGWDGDEDYASSWAGVDTRCQYEADEDLRCWVHYLGLPVNQLSGAIPSQLGNLSNLTGLDLGGNQLSGAIPAELGNLSNLTGLGLGGNQLTGAIPSRLGNLSNLAYLRLNHNQLTGAIPSELGNLSNLADLALQHNQLTGAIPSELGNLSNLTDLDLQGNQLTGAIPSELGNLSNLTWLTLAINQLTGAIPSELGNLSNLTWLTLDRNQLTGAIPSELGNLSNLTGLGLGGNQLSGAIPPELGNLSNLTGLWLGGNQLSGTIPADLGNLSNLTSLHLEDNQLTGAIPLELGNLSNLKSLWLGNNQLTGAIPLELVKLTNLEGLFVWGNDLCEPADSAFQAWANSLQVYHRLPSCSSEIFAEVFQVTQRPGLHGRDEGGFVAPEALLAGRGAVLRIAPLAEEGSGDRVARVRVWLHNGNRQFETDSETDGLLRGPFDADLPSKVNFSSLDATFNLEIPVSVVQPPDLRIEVEVSRTSSDGAVVVDTIETKTAVPVRALPHPLDLTLVPVHFAGEDPDPTLTSFVEEVRRRGASHPALSKIRELLPVNTMVVRAASSVKLERERWQTEFLLGALALERMRRGMRGYFMGVLSTAPEDPDDTPGERTLGAAAQEYLEYPVAFSLALDGGIKREDLPVTMAHELGHLLSLGHAPCGVKVDLDRGFPQIDGTIGAWGYDFSTSTLVADTRPDLMSYCDPPRWVSSYNFKKAFDFRWRHRNSTRFQRSTGFGEASVVASNATGNVLLLWGSIDAEGSLRLNPAFVLDWPPTLPGARGAYEIAGRSADGETLFTFSFAMSAIAGGPEGAAFFAFAVPVRPEWEGRLSSIHLAGPGGSVTLGEDTDIPMALVMDPATGELRAVLHDVTPAEAVVAAEVGAVRAGPSPLVHISRGLPNELRRQP